jgi:hypothetical protein
MVCYIHSTTLVLYWFKHWGQIRASNVHKNYMNIYKVSWTVCPWSQNIQNLRQICLDKFVLMHNFSRKCTYWTWHGKEVCIFVLTGIIPWWLITKILHKTQPTFLRKIQLVSPYHTAIITFDLKLFQFSFMETQIFWLWVNILITSAVHAAKSIKTSMTTRYATLWAS